MALLLLRSRADQHDRRPKGRRVPRLLDDPDAREREAEVITTEPTIITTKSGLTATLYLGDCREVRLPRVNAVVTDPPFSERTHAGHFAVSNAADGAGYDGSARKPLGYASWSDEDARRFVADTALTDGWVVVMNDHLLSAVLFDAAAHVGRYPFAPLPFYAPGSTCRLCGDGPSSWTTWINVSRTKAQSRWGTLPGGYVQGKGWDDKEYMGGKPTLLMQALVGDYSRRGDLVADPYMGSGTTGVACLREGRNFFGVEINPTTFAIAERRIRAEAAQAKMF